jgi:ABC-type Fe3+-siderophore transport system permease subunit
MDDLGPALVIAVALGLAGLIFWRLHRGALAHSGVIGASKAAANSGAPVGAAIPLGQWAVAPDRQWLLLQPGE